jgi:hypothetical protein
LITAVTLGELSFGPHATDDPLKRAARVAVLQHAEATFDPLPYDHAAARLYGQICAAVRAAGRQPRTRASDLMIAATAASNACRCTPPIPATSAARRHSSNWSRDKAGRMTSDRAAGRGWLRRARASWRTYQTPPPPRAGSHI